MGKGVFLLVFLEWVGNFFSSVADLLWYSFASAPFTVLRTVLVAVGILAFLRDAKFLLF